MRKILFVLLALITSETIFPMDNINVELSDLMQKLKSQRVYSWFVLGASSFVISHYLGNQAALLEKDLKQKWFWNTQTEQEELPADADQTTPQLYYWGGKAATLIGWVSCIWGLKQSIYVTSLKFLIKKKEIELEDERKRTEQENDPGFKHWRKNPNNMHGSYSSYQEDEAANAFYEAFYPAFRQWRKANPGGSYEEYQSSNWSSGSDNSKSSGSGTYNKPQPSQPTTPLKTYYEILGVAPTASNAQIKRAYIALAKENHPSTSSNARDLTPEERTAREALFKNVTDAYDTLKDPTLKAIYDRGWNYTPEEQRRANVIQEMKVQAVKRQREAEAESKRKRAL